MSDATNPSLRVSITLGLTIPHPDIQFVMAKPEIRISDIDPAGDVEAQVDAALTAAGAGFARLDGKLEEVLSEILTPHSGIPSLRSQMSEFASFRASMTGRFNTLIRKLKESPELRTAATAAIQAEAEVPDLAAEVLAAEVAQERAKGVPIRDDGTIVGSDGVGIDGDASADYVSPRRRSRGSAT